MKDIIIAAPIGVCCLVKGTTRNGTATLRLLSESGVDDGAYYPAQDVQVYGTEQVTTLRNFCNQLLSACQPDAIPVTPK